MKLDQAGTAKLEVHLPSPHAKQDLFIHSEKKRRIIKAGRRGGKTVGVSIYAVEQFCQGRRVLYGVPVSDQLESFWRSVKNALSQGIDDGLLVKNETEHVIEWNPDVVKRLDPKVRKQYLNTRIRAKTCWNADTLRGDFADRLILDEFHLMNEDAWTIVGSPMLIDNFGDALFCYTPPSLHSRSVSKAKDKLHASKLFAKALTDPDWLALHFTSYDNPFLSSEGLDQVTKDMTNLAMRQEIMAEELDEVPGALWAEARAKIDGVEYKGRKLLDRLRVLSAPPLVRIVIGVDPTGSTSNEAGIIGAGIDSKGHGYVIDDASLLGSPEAWGSASVMTYRRHKADRIDVETNYGGDMAISTIHAVDENVPVSAVDATRGKLVRAEPVCALYERGMVHHVGEFPSLEDELLSYVPGDKSPNRMDALVWAITDLMLGSSALGLVEYYKSGQAEGDLKTLGKIQAASTLAKPMVAESAPACPKCGSKFFVKNGYGFSCNVCHHSWLPEGVNPPQPQYATRKDMLK